MDTWEPWVPAISGRSIQHYIIKCISCLSQNLWSDCQQSFRSIYEVPTCLNWVPPGKMINFGSFAQRNALGLWFNNLESSNRADQWYDKILVQSGFDKSLIWQWICSKGTPLIRNWTKGTHPKINLKSLKTYPLALLSTARKASVQHLMSQSWSCCHCCGYPQSILLFLIKVTIPSPLVDQTHLKRYTMQFGIFGYSLNLTNV